MCFYGIFIFDKFISNPSIEDVNFDFANSAFIQEYRVSNLTDFKFIPFFLKSQQNSFERHSNLMQNDWSNLSKHHHPY